MSRNPVFAGALAVVLIGMLGIVVEAHEVGASGETYAIPDEHHISGVPFVKQKKMWCGPASLTMILNYWGDRVNQSEIGTAVDPEHDGTAPLDLISFLELRGYVVYEFDRDSLKYRSSAMDELKIWNCQDYPIVVLQWMYFPGSVGHYRVVVGYDTESIYVKDPNSGSISFSIETFLELWDKNNEYGLIVMGDLTKDSDGDQMTDSNEVMQNTDPFDMLAQESFPTWIVAPIMIITIVGIGLAVYFTKVKKTTGRSNNSNSKVSSIPNSTLFMIAILPAVIVYRRKQTK
jgi:predicted double-glycine peptidase